MSAWHAKYDPTLRQGEGVENRGQGSPQPRGESIDFWQQIKWPLIVVGLLGGHAFIMLIAMTFAIAGPPMDIPEDYRIDTLAHQPTQTTLPKKGQE